MTESVHPVLAAAATYRRQLLQREDAAVRRLVTAYGTAYQRAGAQIQALREILTDEPMTRQRAGNLAQLRALRQQIETELTRFGVIADNEFNQLTQESIRMGLQHSTGLIASYFGNPQARQALTASLTMLVPEQVETLLGFLAPDSPLRQGLSTNLGAEVARRVSDRMVDGMVRGFNPNKTAGIIRAEMGVGLAWAINTTRTANLWAYREATRANYVANSRVVKSWTHYATLDGRVCGNCLSQHGTEHELSETLNGHNQCRCVPLPNLYLAKSLGLDLPEIEPGESWFKRQDESMQRDILGPGMLEAWKAGAVQFNQFRSNYDHPAYGEMQRMPSMAELGLDKFKQSGGRPAQTPKRTSTAKVPAKVAAQTSRPRKEKTTLLDVLGIKPFATSPSLPENSNVSLANVTVESDGTIAQAHLSDYRRIPNVLRAAVEAEGVKVFINNDQTMTGIDRQEQWKGVQPRGWPDGMTWDIVPGAYDQGKRYVIAGSGNHQGSSLLLHEYGHAAGHAIGYNNDQRLIDIHRRIFPALTPYYAQGGPGAEAGRSELLAEAFAFTILNRNAAVAQFGQEIVDFIENVVLKAGPVQ